MAEFLKELNDLEKVKKNDSDLNSLREVKKNRKFVFLVSITLFSVYEIIFSWLTHNTLTVDYCPSDGLRKPIQFGSQ